MGQNLNSSLCSRSAARTPEVSGLAPVPPDRVSRGWRLAPGLPARRVAVVVSQWEVPFYEGVGRVATEARTEARVGGRTSASGSSRSWEWGLAALPGLWRDSSDIRAAGAAPTSRRPTGLSCQLRDTGKVSRGQVTWNPGSWSQAGAGHSLLPTPAVEPRDLQAWKFCIPTYLLCDLGPSHFISGPQHGSKLKGEEQKSVS